jgi:LuxR family maltose regulon positive regulatory protein
MAQGRINDARAWALDVGLSADDPLSYLHEYEHATLVRLLIAEGMRDRDDTTVDAAIGLGERLLAAAESGGRNGSAIDIRIALALAHQARGHRAEAAAALDRAVALAAPEGYVRVFLDEGERMATLLASATKRPDAPPYMRELVAASHASGVRGAGDGTHRAAARQPLVEPLSDRELEVLRYLGSDLDGPDIARELSVSLNTLRTHTKNVYAKLGVNSRRAAVSRAADLGLLHSTGDPRPSI